MTDPPPCMSCIVKGSPIPSSKLNSGPPKQALKPVLGEPRLAMVVSAIMSPMEFPDQELLKGIDCGFRNEEVTPGKDSEAEDGVTEAEHDAKRAEDTDQLIGYDVDPDDGEEEAGDGEDPVVDGGLRGPGGEAHRDGEQQREDEDKVPGLHTGPAQRVIGHTRGEH